MKTLYWHDYETTGLDPKADRAMQFAGLRTDENLNIIGQPLNIYCQLSPDVLPHPQAVLVTGISPQYANAHGLPEADFIRQIHQELALLYTCGVGYNSLRFDDEFSRYGFYRNFIDPYAREWEADNSRWDIIDMLRMTRALRPEGIAWPNHADGSPDFRLETLTQANHIAHDNAHNALADVHASIAMARLVKQKQPRLYAYLFDLRHKKKIEPQLQLFGDLQVHSSGMLSNVHLHTSLLLPLWRDSFNRNKIIAYDVRYSPADLLQLDVKTLRYRLFTANDALSADEPRLHLKGIHLNKCPAIAPLTTLDAASIERLHLDVAQCQHHAEQLRQARPAIVEKLIQIFQQPDYADSDVEHQLYHGFFNDDDKEKIRKVQQTPPAQLARMKLDFFDARLPALLFRYRARNAPDSLNLAEQQQWNEFCRQRLSQKTGGGNITLAEYFQQIQQLRAENPQIEQQKLLDELQSHGEMLANRYGIEL